MHQDRAPGPSGTSASPVNCNREVEDRNTDSVFGIGHHKRHGGLPRGLLVIPNPFISERRCKFVDQHAEPEVAATSRLHDVVPKHGASGPFRPERRVEALRDIDVLVFVGRESATSVDHQPRSSMLRVVAEE
jgi:hypothetical protein